MEPLYAAIKSKNFKWNLRPTMNGKEFETMIKEMFAASDIDRNGVLVVNEFKQFTLYVLDACTTLRLAEDTKTYHDLFQNFDKNRDGILSYDEIWTGMNGLYKHALDRHFTWEANPRMSVGEYQAMVKEMFDCSDTNRSGKLQPEELEMFNGYLINSIPSLRLQ